MIFLVVLAIITLAVSMSNARTTSDADLTNYLATHSNLYNYSDWHITNRVDTEFQDYIEIEFAYRYKRRAKTHIAVIRGVYLSVDNAFVNNCIDHPYTFQSITEDCEFVTEMGTIESVESDHTSVIIDKWGVLSRDNLEKSLLSKETFHFLNGLLNVFKIRD